MTTPTAELADARAEHDKLHAAFRRHMDTCPACWPVVCPEALGLDRRADSACERVVSLETVG